MSNRFAAERLAAAPRTLARLQDGLVSQPGRGIDRLGEKPCGWYRARSPQSPGGFRATIRNMVRTLQIPYDDSVLLEVSLPQADFEREAKILLAAKLFEMGRLSSGKAAELCGMGRVEFLASLQRVGVSMSNLRPEDVADEVAFAERP